MSLIATYFGDAVQAALAISSTILVVISFRAYRKRPEGRYLLLMLAFAAFWVVSLGNAALDFVASPGLGLASLLEVYLIPSMELLMVLSFLIALVWSSKLDSRFKVVFLVAFASVGLVASTAYLSDSQNTAQSVLPAGCVKQMGGFLIIASSLGYNDSIAHGAPAKSWPVLDVTKGTNVNITLCNTYSQAVGFQVTHYLTDKLETIQPGQVINVSFFANETGSFQIYCSVFNPIHLYLQGGELNVL